MHAPTITPDYSTFWPDEIHALPNLDSYTETTRTVDGLVLMKNTDGNRINEYRRVGTFRYQDEEDCWLLMKRQRPDSSQSPVYDDIEECAFTII